MADTVARTTAAPLTEDAFLADRQRFWGSFSHFIVICVTAVVAVLVVMAIFLV